MIQRRVRSYPQGRSSKSSHFHASTSKHHAGHSSVQKSHGTHDAWLVHQKHKTSRAKELRRGILLQSNGVLSNRSNYRMIIERARASRCARHHLLCRPVDNDASTLFGLGQRQSHKLLKLDLQIRSEHCRVRNHFVKLTRPHGIVCGELLLPHRTCERNLLFLRLLIWESRFASNLQRSFSTRQRSHQHSTHIVLLLDALDMFRQRRQSVQEQELAAQLWRHNH